jgi:pyroglutamyl-peptidase
LSWRAIEATHSEAGPRLAAFVHVPLIGRSGASPPSGTADRVTLEQLVDAGEAMLLEMVKLTRQAVREDSRHR